MCGIAGALSLSGAPLPPSLVERMTSALSHRGPDDEGYFHSGPISLGHRRLSLIDLGGGHQPMGNEAGDVVVVFNGEVYNFAELRTELEARGHRFRTRSDTEVIPHAHEEWGDAAVERMRGMFAYAIWDARRRRLTLARDRLGVKPLFWARAGDRLMFASELKALLAGGAPAGIERRLDMEALHDYLSLLVPLAPRTLFAGVSQLEPGTVLTVEGVRISVRRYWEPVLAPDPALDERQALAELEDRLREVLRDQVVADVPVGAFLSGGIDSSLLVSFLAEDRLEPLDTFTIGFDDRSVDEAPFARVVADRFRTRHHELRVGAGAAGHDLVSRVLDQFDQPFGDSSAIPTWLVSRETRRFVKTVISGDGGDELFGGYVAYRVASQLGALRRLPPAARAGLSIAARLLAGWAPGGAREAGRRLSKALAIAALSPGEALCALRSYFDEPAKEGLYRPEIVRGISGYRTADRFTVPSTTGDLATDLAACDLRHRLASDMLCKVDMMSMSHGLEVRVPLLDERIVDLALRLPPELRLRRGTTKYLLRRAASRRLPKRVANKPKGGFVIPLRGAAGPGLDQLLSETLGGPKPRVASVFRMEVVHQYVEAFSSDRRPPAGMSRWQLDQRVYALAALEKWMAKWEVGV